MNEIWTSEETAIYALTMTFLEEPPKEEPKEIEVIEGEVEEVTPPPFYRQPIPRRWAILLCSCLLIASTIVSTILITNEDAFIPAGSLATNGQVTVSAHVTTSGSQGNIQAGDFSGPCCRDYVFARTSQFSGGQEARDFTVVSQSDVDGLTQSLSSQITQQIQQDLQGKVSPQETLTTPVCTQHILTSMGIGEEAQEVTVS